MSRKTTKIIRSRQMHKRQVRPHHTRANARSFAVPMYRRSRSSFGDAHTAQTIRRKSEMDSEAKVSRNLAPGLLPFDKDITNNRSTPGGRHTGAGDLYRL